MKVKTEFLKKVLKERIIYTKKYQYKTYMYTDINEKEEFYNLYVIKRIDINYVDTTRYLDEIFWEDVAITKDGETFMTF